MVKNKDNGRSILCCGELRILKWQSLGLHDDDKEVLGREPFYFIFLMCKKWIREQSNGEKK